MIEDDKKMLLAAEGYSPHRALVIAPGLLTAQRGLRSMSKDTNRPTKPSTGNGEIETGYTPPRVPPPPPPPPAKKK